MNRLLFVGILLLGTAPLYAQGQQPNVAKLKADAQKVVSVISGDKAKTQAYCQIAKISEQVDQAAREKDRKKAEELVQKINELEKQLGPEYLALVDALFNNNDMNLNSEDFEEIVSMFDRFDEACRHYNTTEAATTGGLPCCIGATIRCPVISN
jgi:DNA repair ATPase RecN